MMDAERDMEEEEEEYKGDKLKVDMINKTDKKMTFVITDTIPQFVNALRRIHKKNSRKEQKRVVMPKGRLLGKLS